MCTCTGHVPAWLDIAACKDARARPYSRSGIRIVGTCPVHVRGTRLTARSICVIRCEPRASFVGSVVEGEDVGNFRGIGENSWLKEKMPGYARQIFHIRLFFFQQRMARIYRNTPMCFPPRFHGEAVGFGRLNGKAGPLGIRV